MTLHRGRVIPPAELPGDVRPLRAAPTPVTERARVVPAAIVDSHVESAAIIAAAEREAEAITAAARASAGAVRDAVIADARAHADASAAALMLKVRAAEHASLAAREAELVDVARLLAERLLGAALALDPSLVVTLAQQALATFARARRVTLFARPEDVVALREGVATGRLDAIVDVQEDASLGPGDLRASTDLGTFDAAIAPQLDRLLAALRSHA